MSIGAAERKRGVVLGYISLLIRVTVGLMIIPFIIHHVGVSDYGIFSLVSALVGYLIILEAGLANTTVRFLSQINATDDRQQESMFLGKMLVIYCGVSALTVCIGIGFWLSLPALFSQSLSVSELQLLQQTFIVLLVNITLTLMTNSFAGVISAHEKFSFQKGLDVALFIMRTLVVVFALQSGLGILSIVIIDTIMNLIHGLFRVWFVVSKLGLRISLQIPDRKTFRDIYMYTAFIALNVIVNQINWRVDNFIIASMMDSKSVGIFSIGTQLILSYVAFAGAISSIFVPKLNRMVALKASLNDLVEELIKIGRLQLFVLGFILSAFIAFGHTFIQLYVGEEFESAFWVVLIAIIPFTLVLCQTSTTTILQAMNLHKVRSLIILATAIGNIFVSIWLVGEHGIVGAAVGTALALFLGEIVIVTVYLQRVVGLNMSKFYRMLLTTTVPTIFITCLIGRLLAQLFPVSWFGLIAQSLLLGGVYLVLLFTITLSKNEKVRILEAVGFQEKRTI